MDGRRTPGPDPTWGAELESTHGGPPGAGVAGSSPQSPQHDDLASTRGLARRPPRPSGPRRGQARRVATGPIAVIVVLVLGVSLLAIVLAQVILGSDRLGPTGPAAVVDRSAATLVIPNARPPRPVLDTQSAELAPPPPPGARPLTTAPALGDLVQKHLGDQRGSFAVAIKDLDSGQGLLVNADKEMPTASLFKLPVMYEVYKQRDAGRLSFAERLTVTPDYARHDLGTLEVPVGSTVTVGWALDRMITRSDNAMANLLADKVGWTNLNNTMQELGLKETRFVGQRLTTSARDMLRLLEIIALGKGPSAPADTEMVQLLLDQRVNDRIPAQLPPDTPVAHKTGNLAGIAHDVGIVYSPNATFIISLLAAETTDDAAVSRAEAALSRAVYDYFNPAGEAPRRSALRAPSAAARATPLPPLVPAGTAGTATFATPGLTTAAPQVTLGLVFTPQPAPTAAAAATIGRTEAPTVEPARA